MENSVNPDQLASQKPADPDLHCFQYKVYISAFILFSKELIHSFSTLRAKVNLYFLVKLRSLFIIWFLGQV